MARSRKLALAGAVLLPMVVGGFLLQSRSPNGSPNLLSQVFTIVASRYVDTLSDSVMYERAAMGLVHQLNDPFSELLTPADMKEFNTRIDGHYGGVGMLIEDRAGAITITKVYPNSPAEAAGVREGDRIIKVDTLSTSGWSLSQVSNYVTGTPGTEVSVRFSRPGVPAPIDFKFKRAIIVVPAVPYTLMLDGDIGYLPLQSFTESSADETAASIHKLLAAGAKRIVLDLRGNPGGILDQSIDIASIFLKSGQEVLTVRSRNPTPETYAAKGNPTAPTIPMIVLTDQNTASAAEIVSGSLQDHDRALILGEPSFGKGLVQSVYNLDGGYALKLTTAKWYTPSGRSIQRPRTVVDGRFVPEAPDTLSETGLAKTKRPAYKSDAGRTVYGGGGITPDVIVPSDTLTTAEQSFYRAISPKSQDYNLVLYDYGLQLSRGISSNFQVLPAWRDEFYSRLQAKGVIVDRKLFDAAQRYVDRSLNQLVAHLAFGDSAAKRRDIPFDRPLQKAIDLLAKGQSQQELFVVAKNGMKH